MTTTTIIKTYKCESCGVEKPGKRAKGDGVSPPQNWKRVCGKLVCPDCCKRDYSIRCVTIRVAGIVGASWDDLRGALRFSFRRTTEIANWAYRELAKADDLRIVDGKITKHDKPYLYGLANTDGVRRMFSSGATLSTITRAVQMYASKRWDMARGAASLPTARYPQPFICAPNKSTLELSHNDERIVCNLPIDRSEEETTTFALLLAQGWNNERTTAAVKRMMAGEVDLREVSIREQGRDLMLSFVGLFPREKKTREGTIYVRSGSDIFCECISAAKSRVWVIHADHVRRWQIEHAKRMQHLSDDQKAEGRNRKGRKRFQGVRDQLCAKHHRRMHTFAQKKCAEIAGWALRMNAETVLWDGWHPKESAPRAQCFGSFPWYQFRTMLIERLKQDGVTLVCHADEPPTEETQSESLSAPKKSGTARKSRKQKVQND